MIKQQRTVEYVNIIIANYLKRGNLFTENAPWVLKESSFGGLGLFATRDIQIGEVIFRDYPVIIGPRSGGLTSEMCVYCYKQENLQQCKNGCGLLICSKNCRNSNKHRRECKIIRQWNSGENLNEFTQKLMRNLTPIRSLLLSEDDKQVMKNLTAHKGNQHGREINVLKNEVGLNIKEDEEFFMRFVCSVLDANAFEVIVGDENKQLSIRGLYPLGGLVNHCCIPNTMHVFDNQQRMIVRASTFIADGEEIYFNYTRLLWGTLTRRYHLKYTKHFNCQCARCTDPTEFKSYTSAIVCKKCRSNVVPVDPLDFVSKWRCEDCGDLLDKEEITLIIASLGLMVSSFDETEVQNMLKLLNEKMVNLVHKNNQNALELKYKLIWILGYSQGYLWHELSDELLKVKQQMCNDLLLFLRTLGAGQCKMRGLLLYQLYCTRKERRSRKLKNEIVGKIKINETQLKRLLNEAADILMYDVGAPKEVKENWLVM